MAGPAPTTRTNYRDRSAGTVHSSVGLSGGWTAASQPLQSDLGIRANVRWIFAHGSFKDGSGTRIINHCKPGNRPHAGAESFTARDGEVFICQGSPVRVEDRFERMPQPTHDF